MRVLIYVLYLIVFLLDCGNNVYSERQCPIHYAANQGMEKPYSFAVFNEATVNDLDDDGFADLVEETSNEVNEYSSGKVFPKKDSFQNSYILSFSRQFIVSNRFISPVFRSPLPVGGSSFPIYLTNRSLRI